MENGTLTIETRILDPRLGGEFPLPRYATAGAAGLDLVACLDEPRTIARRQVLTVGSGIALSIRDSRYMALLAPRSGLGVKHGIVLANSVGVIDSDYQDEIKVALFNRGEASYEIRPGERICQLIVLPVARAMLKIVQDFSRQTPRGVGGFGSTGRF